MELTFEQITNEFSIVMNYETKKFKRSVSQPFYDKDDFYQDGLIILYNCWNKYREKPINEFKIIFAVSLRRLLRYKLKKDHHEQCKVMHYYNIIPKDLNSDITRDSAYEELQGDVDDNLNNILVEDEIIQLKMLLKNNYIALAILEELLNPSERTNWELKMDMERRKMLQNQGHTEIRLIASTDIRMHHIARALEISINDLNKGLRDIRRNASNIFK